MSSTFWRKKSNLDLNDTSTRISNAVQRFVNKFDDPQDQILINVLHLLGFTKQAIEDISSNTEGEVSTAIDKYYQDEDVAAFIHSIMQELPDTWLLLSETIEDGLEKILKGLPPHVRQSVKEYVTVDLLDMRVPLSNPSTRILGLYNIQHSDTFISELEELGNYFNHYGLASRIHYHTNRLIKKDYIYA